jgi:hypothetical protein
MSNKIFVELLMCMHVVHLLMRHYQLLLQSWIMVLVVFPQQLPILILVVLVPFFVFSHSC